MFFIRGPSADGHRGFVPGSRIAAKPFYPAPWMNRVPLQGRTAPHVPRRTDAPRDPTDAADFVQVLRSLRPRGGARAHPLRGPRAPDPERGRHDLDPRMVTRHDPGPRRCGHRPPLPPPPTA